MSTQDKKQSKSLTKSKRKKRGIIQLAEAVVCLVVYWVLQQLTTLGTKFPGIFAGLLVGITVCFLVCLIAGLYNLITGFTKKE